MRYAKSCVVGGKRKKFDCGFQPKQCLYYKNDMEEAKQLLTLSHCLVRSELFELSSAYHDDARLSFVCVNED